MKLFIYVFSEADRDKLLSNGFQLLCEDKQTGRYVFENDGHMDFSADPSLRFALSDTLTF